MNWFRVTWVLIVGVLYSVPIVAQESECSAENPDACDVTVPLYCQQKGKVPFTFGINDDFDFGFTAVFSDSPPAKQLIFYAVDGEAENGSVNETKVTKLVCRGTTCTGAISLERAQKLEQQFDFDQAVINFVLRAQGKNGKDVCLGKFTNNPDLVAQNDGGKRVVCTVQPTDGNEAITGTGYFEPGGYGSDGDSFFHLALEGLDVGTSYKGCSVVGENRFRKVFAFDPALRASATDSEVYGVLSAKEQAVFDAHRSEYSYDLFREVYGSGDIFNPSFSPSLSLINKGVSEERASSSVRSSNKSTRAARKRRKRRKKQQGKRTRVASVLADLPGVAIAAKRKPESVLAWLNFDPQGGQLVISPSCKGNVLAQSVATLACGEAAGADPDHVCNSLSFTEDDRSGTACRDFFDGVGQLKVLAKGLELGVYSVCVNDELIAPVLTVVSTTSGGTFGKLIVTDNSTLADGSNERIQLISQVLSEVTDISLSQSGSCVDVVASVSF